MTELQPVHEAWSAVMADVQAIGKDSTNKDQNYMFRGVDAVMNAVGPVLRKHGVFVLPAEVLAITYRDVRTSRDKPAREVTVRVRYRIVGPRGDDMFAESPGESMDFGDKGTAKAMSVAYRILFLQGLTIPTHDVEPDASTYERANETGPVLPADLYQARLAAAGGFSRHYGEATPDAVARCFADWSGSRGVAFMDADAKHVRSFAAMLESLPVENAGAAGLPDEQRAAPASDGAMMSPRQRGMLFALMGEVDLHDKGAQLEWINRTLKTGYSSRSELTFADAKMLIDSLQKVGVEAPSGPA